MFPISCWSFNGDRLVERQRFGCAARDQGLVGTVLLFAEKEYFNDEKAAKAARKARRADTRKQTANEVNLPGAAHLSKCAAVSSVQATPSSSHSHLVHPLISQLNDGVEGDANGLFDEESDIGEGETAPVQIPVEPAGGLEALLEAAIKEKSSEFHTTSGKWRKRDLDPTIDYLINAEGYDCIGCQRRVFDVCFDNAAAGGKFLYMRMQCTDSFKFLLQTPTTSSVTPTAPKGALAAISCSPLFAATFMTHPHSPYSKLTLLARPTPLNGPISPSTRQWSKTVRWEMPSMIGERSRPQLYLAGPLSMTLGHA